MKKIFILGLISLYLCLAYSNSDDGESNIEGGDVDYSQLILGQWKNVDSTCDFGFTFKEDGTWSAGEFEGCPACGVLAVGGDYTINGDIIMSTGGMTDMDALQGRIEIINDVLRVFDPNSGVLLRQYVRFPPCN